MARGQDAAGCRGADRGQAPALSVRRSTSAPRRGIVGHTRRDGHRGRGNMAELSGKIAWQTGAGSGIGLAGAQALAAAGAHVILSGRRPAVLEEAVAGIKASGHSAEAAPLDVADSAAVAALGAALLKRHKRIDILVNSAGLNIPKRS